MSNPSSSIKILFFVGVILFSPVTLAGPNKDATGKLPPILHDINDLPSLVQEMRRDILKAALTGDLEALRPVLDSNEMKPLVSYGGDEDPIKYWRKISHDGAGREILAAMTEVLTSRFTKIYNENGNEIYVWPYLAEWPLDKLSPSQEVELYRLVSPKEAKVMREFGHYIHYRIGIGKDGTWHYFVAGD